MCSSISALGGEFHNLCLKDKIFKHIYMKLVGLKYK